MRTGLVLLLSTLVLSACAFQSQIPQFDPQQTLLVIPKAAFNDSLEAWSRNYYVVLKPVSGAAGDEEIKLWLDNDDEAFEAMHSIAPGRYRITHARWRWRGGWRSSKAMDEGYPLDLPEFTIRSGQVTIAPFRFLIFQKGRGAGVSSYIGMDGLDLAGQKQVLKAVYQDEKGQTWEEAGIDYGQTLRQTI